MRRAFTPEGFEAYVTRYLRQLAHSEGWRRLGFQLLQREVFSRAEGNFELDVTVRFRAFAVNFLMLVECKRLSRPVSRDVVQLLHAKMVELGAHKGVVFSTSGFQRGALRLAKRHGVALVDCSPRHKEPVTVFGGEPSDIDLIDDAGWGWTPIEPSFFDWPFHWGGVSFCAEHRYVAHILFGHPHPLEPARTFWRPQWIG